MLNLIQLKFVAFNKHILQTTSDISSHLNDIELQYCNSDGRFVCLFMFKLQMVR